ncbi:MAG: hypothetical protein ACXAEF_05300 [Candidatus Thorarchaeota archaeon]
MRYPTAEQNKVWFKRRKGVPPSQIASEMKVSRPYVSQAQRIAEERIENLLRHTAQVSRIDIQHISAEYGIAIGDCPALDSTIYITYSAKMGVQTWYSHVGDCAGCDKKKECDDLLDTLSLEWGISLPKNLPPTERGIRLFDEIQEVLGWKDAN